MFIVDELPSLDQIENPPQELATKVLIADGKILDMFIIIKSTNRFICGF
jgi:hypothetical protein